MTIPEILGTIRNYGKSPVTPPFCIWAVWSKEYVCKLILSMEQSPSWETNSCGTSQDISDFYGAQRSLPYSQEPAIEPWMRAMRNTCRILVRKP
jgi:hypothetical protein